MIGNVKNLHSKHGTTSFFVILHPFLYKLHREFTNYTHVHSNIYA